MTLLSKANLQVAKVAAADKEDAELAQVWVEEDGSTVASNGAAMMVVEPLRGVPPGLPDMGDVPVADGGVGLPLGLVVEVQKNLPKGNLALELGFVAIKECEGRGGKIELACTDLRVEKKAVGHCSRKRFPEWKHVIRGAAREASKGVKVCVDRRSLIKLLQAMESACVDPDHAVFMEIPENGGGLILRAASLNTRQRAIGYLMPLNIGDQWLPRSKWEKKLFRRSAKRTLKKT